MKTLLLALLLPATLHAQFGEIVEVTIESPTPTWVTAGDYQIRTIPRLNTAGFDYAPSITADGQFLFFVSDRPGGIGGHDIWTVELTGDNAADMQVQTPFLLPQGINTQLNEGICAIAPDGRSLVFTACNRPDGVGDCDLYSVDLVDGIWRNITNLRALNSGHWDSQPTLSGSGDTIFFVSNRPGALGGDDDADIYMAVRDRYRRWGRPIRLGEGVNTNRREDGPFMMPGSSTLYFSSDGHKGHGGLDFFRSELREDGTWSTPENLGEGFNTSADDRFITGVPDGSLFLFSSERETPGNAGGLDIFAAVRTNPDSEMNELEAAGLRVVPNPAQDKIVLLSSKDLPADVEAGELVIYSSSGKGVLVIENYRPEDELDISGIPEGFYFVVFDAGSAGSITTTFVRRL